MSTGPHDARQQGTMPGTPQGTHERGTARLVPLAPAVLGALLATMSLAHLVTVDDIAGGFVALASGTVGIAVCSASLLLRRQRPTGHRAHAVLALCVVLAALEALVTQSTTGSLERSGDLALVVAGACAVLLDRRWLAGTLTLLLGIWGAAALTGPLVLLPFAAATMVVGATSGLALRRARLAALAEVAALEAAAALAALDPLTGLPDRRGLQLVGRHLVAIARREGGAVGCTFVGIDGMAHVGTCAGQAGMDTLVRHVAGITHSVVRGTDVVGRWREGMLVVVTHGAGAPMDVLEQRIATLLAQECPLPQDVWPRRLVLGRAVMQPWDEGGLVTLLAAAERDICARIGAVPPEVGDEERAEAAAAAALRADAVAAEAGTRAVAEPWRTVTARVATPG